MAENKSETTMSLETLDNSVLVVAKKAFGLFINISNTAKTLYTSIGGKSPTSIGGKSPTSITNNNEMNSDDIETGLGGTMHEYNHQKYDIETGLGGTIRVYGN